MDYGYCEFCGIFYIESIEENPKFLDETVWEIPAKLAVPAVTKTASTPSGLHSLPDQGYLEKVLATVASHMVSVDMRQRDVA